jgi:hypothetical protein
VITQSLILKSVNLQKGSTLPGTHGQAKLTNKLKKIAMGSRSHTQPKQHDFFNSNFNYTPRISGPSAKSLEQTLSENLRSKDLCQNLLNDISGLDRNKKGFSNIIFDQN